MLLVQYLSHDLCVSSAVVTWEVCVSDDRYKCFLVYMHNIRDCTVLP